MAFISQNVRSMCLILLSGLLVDGAHMRDAAAQAVGSVSFQANAAHTGALNTSPAFKPPLSKRWAVDLGGSISYPIVANNMIFVTVSNISNYGTRVFALDAATGNTVWQKAIGGPYYLSYLSYENGMIYDLNYSGLLQAYNASNGASVWSIQIPNQSTFEDPPVGSGKNLYVAGAGSGGTIYSIDGTTGAIQWTFQTNSGGGTPAVAQNTVLVGVGCDTYAVSQQFGKLVWHDNGGCSGGFGGDVAIIGKYGFVPYFNGGQSGAVLDLASGTIKDAIGLRTAAFSGALAIQTQGTMTATEYLSGNIAWSFTPQDKLNVPPLVVNGVAYALSDSGNLYAVSAKKGKLMQTLQPGIGKNASQGAAVKPGLGAGPNILVVPSVSLLTAYGP